MEGGGGKVGGKRENSWENGKASWLVVDGFGYSGGSGRGVFEGV